jgi:Holliday junction resolvase-like predicted endonuclease
MTRTTPEEARRLVAKSRGKQPETAIRTQIREWLQWRGWDVTIHPQNVLSRKGFSDLTAVRHGETVYVEVKTPRGTQSDHQKAFQAAMESHGAKYLLARSVEDVEALR